MARRTSFARPRGGTRVSGAVVTGSLLLISWMNRSCSPSVSALVPRSNVGSSRSATPAYSSRRRRARIGVVGQQPPHDQRLGHRPERVEVVGGPVEHPVPAEFTGEVNNKRGASVRRSPLSTFVEGGPLYVRTYDEHQVDVLPAGETCRIANMICGMSQSGDYGRYHLLDNNWEHLATLCKVGVPRSAQVDNARAAVTLPLLTQLNPGAAVLAAIGMITGARRRAWSDHRIMEYIPG
ncbi:lecithin retinol acyltransferase family protein [Polymorphospora sp. NPDC050346]|uniref:lecithin retinol acyltransferase family protein n=1 Tax=Polymorphospora sp. NPDC050346 TaxID=3155780 RepID=UPI0033D48D21